VCLLLAAAAVSGAQPNGTALPGNAHYLLPAAEAWTTPLPAAAAGPAALDTLHVYVPLADGRVVALARQSGAVAWTGAVGAVGAPYPSGERVLVPTRDGIAVLDARTGAPVWIVPVAGAPFGSLVVERGVVAAMADDGRVTALDLATGEVRWSRALGLPAVPALAASAGRLHVAMDDARVVTLATDDGRILWERALEGVLTAPAVNGQRLAVGSAANALFGLDAGSGNLAWRWRTGGDVVGAAVGAGHVYVTALDNRLRALARGSGNQRWQRPLSTRPAHPPIVVGEVVLVSGVSPEIAAFDALTGQALGSYTAPAELRGPVLVDPAPRTFDVALALVTRTSLAIGLRPTGLQLAEPPLAPLAELPGRRLLPE
jgi:outer membrane protein assembly factor BamB